MNGQGTIGKRQRFPAQLQLRPAHSANGPTTGGKLWGRQQQLQPTGPCATRGCNSRPSGRASPACCNPCSSHPTISADSGLMHPPVHLLRRAAGPRPPAMPAAWRCVARRSAQCVPQGRSAGASRCAHGDSKKALMGAEGFGTCQCIGEGAREAVAWASQCAG